MNPESDTSASSSSDDKTVIERHLKELEAECKNRRSLQMLQAVDAYC